MHKKVIQVNLLSAKQRGIFKNLIRFAEFHPTKLRIGVYTTAGAARGSSHFLVGSRVQKDSRSIASSHTIKVGGESRIRTGGTVLPVRLFSKQLD